MSTSAERIEHAPGYRTAVRILWIGAVAVPAFWFGEMLINAALNGYVCFPGSSPRQTVASGWEWVIWIRYLLEAGAAMLCAAGLIVSYRIWGESQRDRIADPLADESVGRTGFAALWGMLFSGSFLLAVIFDFTITMIMPVCT